jgi:hypothetical protein
MKGLPLQQGVVGVQCLPITGARSLRLLTDLRCHAVVIPGDFELVTVFLPLNSRGADESGQCPRGVRSSREAKDIYFISRHKIGNDGLIDVLNDLLQT